MTPQNLINELDSLYNRIAALEAGFEAGFEESLENFNLLKTDFDKLVVSVNTFIGESDIRIKGLEVELVSVKGKLASQEASIASLLDRVSKLEGIPTPTPDPTPNPTPTPDPTPTPTTPVLLFSTNAVNFDTKSTGSAIETTSWLIGRNGYISKNFNADKAGKYSIEVYAKGQLAGSENPKMKVEVVGVKDYTVEVPNTDYAKFTFGFDLTTGAKVLKISFLNDFYLAPNDRNLIVQKADFFL